MTLTKQITLASAVTITATGAQTEVALPATCKNCSGYMLVSGPVTGTTPSMTVTLQHSADAATWRDLVAFAAITATGSLNAMRANTENLVPLLPYVRASYTVTGTTPSFGAVTIVLLVDE